MKVLLLQDVYNLGRAGDVKKVANGFGRNYLIPQGMAVLATPGSLKQVDRIREDANKHRAILNKEMAGVAEKIADLQLLFSARAGETGKLFGSVTTQMVANELTEQTGVEINKRQIDTEPLRQLGMHTVRVRLTIDLIPEISVVIYREGESPENYMVAAEELAGELESLVEEEVEATPAPSGETAEPEASPALSEETSEPEVVPTAPTEAEGE